MICLDRTLAADNFRLIDRQQRPSRTIIGAMGYRRDFLCSQSHNAACCDKRQAFVGRESAHLSAVTDDVAGRMHDLDRMLARSNAKSEKAIYLWLNSRIPRTKNVNSAIHKVADISGRKTPATRLRDGCNLPVCLADGLARKSSRRCDGGIDFRGSGIERQNAASEIFLKRQSRCG